VVVVEKPWVLEEPSFVYSDEGLLSTSQILEAAQRLESRILECAACSRLEEVNGELGQETRSVECSSCGGVLSPLLDREIDGYRLDEVLNRGGFGTVYLASNIAEPKMKAVVKVLRPKLVRHRPELVKIFVEEARLTEEIGQTCWNIVRVSNVREKPWPYYFMEYVRGTTLDNVIRGSRPRNLPIPDCKGYLRGIAKALAATHARGRVHRDLKPLNIMVIESQEISPEERIKLLDFGLSMTIAQGNAKSGLESGPAQDFSESLDAPASPIAHAGTPEFMAPEAFSGRIDPAGDIYSFGVTAYEVLTGENPLGPAASGQDRLSFWWEAHRDRPPRPIREARPEVPKRLARAIMQCLEKDPSKRPRSASELLSHLREPLPRWAWLAFAATAVLVGTLAVSLFISILSRATVREAQWKMNGEDFQNPLKVFVKEEGDLLGLDILASAGTNRPVVTCSSPSDLVRCDVEKEGVRVRFQEGVDLSSLLGSTVLIRGEGKGFRLEGAIEIEKDDLPPILGKVKILELGTGSPPRDFPALPRLNPEKVQLAVTIIEDHLRRASLALEGQADSIRGNRETLAGEDYLTFPLSRLGPGSYRGHVKATDAAGNSKESPSFDFIIDNDVSLTLSEREQELIAKRKAFYKFRIEEPIEVLSVRPTGSSKEIDWAILDAGAAKSALEFSSKLDRLKPESLNLLESGRDYFLVVPLPGESEASFELLVKDTAIGTNKRSWTLGFNPPGPLKAADIQRVTMKLEGESSPLEVLPPFKVETPTRSRTVKDLLVDFGPGRVHRATCTVAGTTKEAQVEDKSLSLHDLALDASPQKDSTRNGLLLEFFDPLERSLSIEVVVLTDIRPPGVRVHSRPKGNKLEIEIDGDEPLKSALCSITGRAPLDGKSMDGGSSRFRFDLEGLSFAEGPVRFRIEAFDLAGMSVSRDVQVVINTGPPRVTPLAKKIGDSLRLEGDYALFEISDGNDLEYESAKVTFEDRTRVAPIEVKIESPEANTIVHRVSLDRLPDDSRGVLTVHIADKEGSHTQERWRYEFSRPAPRWRSQLPWEGLDLVLVPVAVGKDFYVSRCEIPNKAYWKAYRAGVVKRKPKFRGNEMAVRGDNFPVVGVHPDDAEAFARYLGGHLPTYEEWRLAGWKVNNGGRYPWRDDPAAKSYSNCYLSWEDRRSPFNSYHHAETMTWGEGKQLVCRAVEVDFDPFDSCPADLLEKLHYSSEILHLIGNVRELVLLPDGAYGVAGGDFGENYEDINLQLESKDLQRFNRPDAKTGFRIVIRPEEASADFQKATRSP
jgi:serine/threonine-protein kinase